MRRRSTIQEAERLWADEAMRERTGLFDVCYEKERRRKIQASLSPLGVDVESLIKELILIVIKFDGFPYWRHVPTPNQVADEIQKTVTIIENLRATLDRYSFNYIDPVEVRDSRWPQMLFPPLKALAIVQLELMRDELQPHIGILVAMEGGRSNAGKVYREYWAALTEL